MRDYMIVVPEDCVASIKPEDNEYALKQMRHVLDADLTDSDTLDFEALIHRSRRAGPEPAPKATRLAVSRSV